jgi:hypothetical protein
MPKRAALHCREVRLISMPPPIRTALERSQIADGLFFVAESVAHAIAESQGIGLCLRVQCGRNAAAVAVVGASEPKRVHLLQEVCERLIESGRRVDLDGRGITYADSLLITTLYRLARSANGCGGDTPAAPPRFRIIPGYTLRAAIERIHAEKKFVLCDAVDLPPDAIETETNVPESLRAPAAGGLPFLPMAAYAPRL